VYDVSSRDTFDELLKWFQEVDTYCGDGVVKVLVGNKVDKVSSSALNQRWKLTFRSSPDRYQRKKGRTLRKGPELCLWNAQRRRMWVSGMSLKISSRR
jgi:GTPase SAR1 family protein